MNTHQKTRHSHTSDDLFQGISSSFSTYFNKYWRPVALVLALIVISAVGYQSYVGRRNTEFETTWNSLAALPDVDPSMDENQQLEALRTIVSECQQLLADRWTTRATPWVLLRLGGAHLELGEPQTAADAFKRIINEYEGHYVYSLALPNLATAFEHMEDYEQAAQIYLLAAEDNRGSAPDWVAVGRSREFAGDRDGAVAAYEKAMELAGDMPRSADYHRMAQFRVKTLARGEELLSPPPPPTPPEPEEDEDEKEEMMREVSPEIVPEDFMQEQPLEQEPVEEEPTEEEPTEEEPVEQEPTGEEPTQEIPFEVIPQD